MFKDTRKRFFVLLGFLACGAMSLHLGACTVKGKLPRQATDTNSETGSASKEDLDKAFKAVAPPCAGDLQKVRMRASKDVPGVEGKFTSIVQCAVQDNDKLEKSDRPMLYKVSSAPCTGFDPTIDFCSRQADCKAGQSCICAGMIPNGKFPKSSMQGWDVVSFGHQCYDIHCPDGCQGLGCARVYSFCDEPRVEFRCHTPEDECGGKKGFCPFLDVCTYSEKVKHWRCEGARDCGE